jgi:hypothetical protein
MAAPRLTFEELEQSILSAIADIKKLKASALSEIDQSELIDTLSDVDDTLYTLLDYLKAVEP